MRSRARIAPRVAAVATLALVTFIAGGCEQILGIPDRRPAANATCADGACTCDANYGDCYDDDGCETPLAANDDHCGACDHGCQGGKCVDGSCEPAPALVQGELFTGPVVFGDTLFIIDRETGDILTSPARGPGHFQRVRENPVPTRYYSDLFAGADGVYALLIPYLAGTGKHELLLLSEAGEATEPFGSIGGGEHSDNFVAATSDAVYVTDAWEITRIDRATLARSIVTNDSDSPARVVGDDVYYLQDDTVFVLHPGGGPAEVVFEEPTFLMCDLFVGSRYFVLEGCGSEAYRIFDEKGTFLVQRDGSPIDAVDHDGTLYWIDQGLKEVDKFDGTEPTPIVESQPFGAGSYKIQWFDGALYWGSFKGVQRIVL